MSFRDDILADIEDIRSIPGEFGVHRCQVWVRVTSYTGSRVAKGTSTVVETRLLVGGQDPHVREIKSKDGVAGDSELQGVTLEIGPLTPEFTTVNVLDPPRAGTTPATTHFVVKGPGFPEDGMLFSRVEDTMLRPFRYMVTVKSVGHKRPTTP